MLFLADVIRILKNSRASTLSSDGDEIGIVAGVAAFDILKDARELTGMRIIEFKGLTLINNHKRNYVKLPGKIGCSKLQIMLIITMGKYRTNYLQIC